MHELLYSPLGRLKLAPKPVFSVKKKKKRAKNLPNTQNNQEKSPFLWRTKYRLLYCRFHQLVTVDAVLT